MILNTDVDIDCSSIIESSKKEDRIAIAYRLMELEKSIVNFNSNEHLTNLKEHYKKKSMLDILRVSRKELVHSSFLEWILSNKETHQLGDFPIKQFMKILVKGINKQTKTRESWRSNEGLLHLIDNEDYQLSSLKFQLEKTVKSGRLDLLVSGQLIFKADEKRNFKLVIENKIYANETKNQTKRYYDEFEKEKSKDDLIFYVYLTPISSVVLEELNSPECSCKNFIHINYQQILGYVLEPSLVRCKVKKLESVISIIRDYITALGKPTVDILNIGKKGDLVMAISKQESEMLTRFYDENNEIILAAISALSRDPNQDEEVREVTANVLESLSVVRGKWGVIKKLRQIYEDMDANSEYTFNQIKVMIKDIYKKERGEEPGDSTINTPLVQTIVNYPGRELIGSVNQPFPKNKTLFYIKDNTISNNDRKIIKKFVPENNVDNIEIIWNNNGEKGNDEFCIIKAQYTNSGDYLCWQNIDLIN